MARAAIIFSLVLMTMYLLMPVTSKYAGLSFKLTRLANDKFKNPTTSTCDWQTRKTFCLDTNSRCVLDCCECVCDYATSTFDTTTMACQDNDVIRSECTVRKNPGIQIKLLDISKKGQANIYFPYEQGSDKLASFKIDSTAWYDSGTKIKHKIISPAKGKAKKSGANWVILVKWKKLSSTYYGKMFRVNISYKIQRGKQELDGNNCFVFKSAGRTTVTFPRVPTKKTPTSPPKVISTLMTSLPSTNMPRSSTAFSEGVSSTEAKSSYPTIPSTKETKEPKGTPKPEASTSESVVTTSNDLPTIGARKSAGDGGSNTLVVSLVVVACLLLVVGLVLFVLWYRRRSTNATKNRGTVIGNRGVDNAMSMSPSENIYAEADSPVNYPGKKGINQFAYDYTTRDMDHTYASLEDGKVESKPAYESVGKGYVYDYAVGGLESNYTSLDKSKVESKPTYQSLNRNNISPSEALAEKEPISEPFYHVVDSTEGNQTPGRDVPGRTGNDDPERVYSVLEDDSAESADYLTILPENLDYEQPINPPVPDA